MNSGLLQQLCFLTLETLSLFTTIWNEDAMHVKPPSNKTVIFRQSQQPHLASNSKVEYRSIVQARQRPHLVLISKVRYCSIWAKKMDFSKCVKWSAVDMPSLWNTKPVPTSTSALRERWMSVLCKDKQRFHQGLYCCEKLNCLENCDQKFLRLKQTLIMQKT